MAEDGGEFIDDNGEFQMNESGENIVLESGENVITRATPPLRKNTVFDSVMDEELLALMLDQIEMGRHGDKGFKSEAYVVVAKSMTKSSGGEYKFIKATNWNRCKKLKAEYASVIEMLNASGFGFENDTHRVVAEDEIWAEWLIGNPKANTWKSRTIDYDKLSMVFGRDIATGQFARSSVNATTGNTKPTTQGNANMSGDMDIAIEHMMHDVRMSSSGREQAAVHRRMGNMPGACQSSWSGSRHPLMKSEKQSMVSLRR